MPNPKARPRDRGTHVVWGEPRQEGWGAQALLALARQLTPEAHERGFSVRVARSQHHHGAARAVAFAAPASAQTSDPGGTTPSSSGYTTSVSASGGREYGTDDPSLEPVVVGSVAKLQADGLAAAPSTRRPRSSTPSGPPTRSSACRTLRRRPWQLHVARLRLLRHRLVRAARRRPPAHAAGLRQLHALGPGRQGRLVHRLHEPRPRLRRHRRPAPRHQRRGRPGGLRGPRWRPVLRSTHGFRARHPLGF